jgi:hypothetical protein
MVNLLCLRSLRTKCWLLAVFILLLSKYHAQKGISFYAGIGGNKVLSKYASAGDLKNKGVGRISSSFNLETKLKFSKHFSASINYLWAKNRITSRFNDVKVTYFNRYTQTGGTLGNLTYVDELYLYGNYIGLNLNYEVPFSKNNFIFSLGLDRALFSSAKNRVDRYYEKVPANSSYSNVEAHQSSSLTGPNFMAVNASLRYGRMIYRDKVGLFAQAIFMYNFIDYAFEYTHSTMGWDENYIYNFSGSSQVNRYHRLKYHSLNFTLGLFYNINFRKNEDR